MIGPVMIGPSSSHTAGVVRIARAALKLLGGVPDQADITFYNSFARTYEGHGSDRAIIAGLLDYKTDDTRIKESLELAKAAGLKVLVTDHHLPGPELPAADAIVNPNQPGCDFPSKAMAGVGVIFYVLLALRARLREIGWFARAGLAEPNLGELLGRADRELLAGQLANFVGRRQLAGLAAAGAIGVGLMSAVNFVLHSDFRWLLLVPPLLWLGALVALAAGSRACSP